MTAQADPALRAVATIFPRLAMQWLSPHPGTPCCSMTYLGFTGSRLGMTEAQKATVAALLLELAPRQARHGDAIGSDAQFHALARTTSTTVIVHPANEPRYRANCVADKEFSEKPPLARNKDIVDNCTVLIATPDSAFEKPRSGTWSTIRYARKQGRRILIVNPDGSVQE